MFVAVAPVFTCLHFLSYEHDGILIEQEITRGPVFSNFMHPHFLVIVVEGVFTLFGVLIDGQVKERGGG